MKKNFSFCGNTTTTTWRKGLLFLLPLIFFSLSFLQAQEMKVLPGPTVICPAKFEDIHTKVGVSHVHAKEVSFKN